MPVAVVQDATCQSTISVNGRSCESNCAGRVGDSVRFETPIGCAASWGGRCDEGAVECPLQVGLEVAFRRQSWPTTIEVVGSGSVVVTSAGRLNCSAGCDFLTPVGTQARFEIEPQTPRVSGATCDQGTCELPPSFSALSASIDFRPAPQHRIEVVVSGAGVVRSDGGLRCQADGGVCALSLEEGSSLLLFAEAGLAASDASVRWTGAACAGSLCSVSVTQDSRIDVAIVNSFRLELVGDGGVFLDGRLAVLPVRVDLAEGSSTVIRALPNPDDTFESFGGLPCLEPSPSMQCTVSLGRSMSGMVVFRPLIDWVLDHDADGGQARVEDVVVSPDGNVWAVATVVGWTNLTVVPTLVAGSSVLVALDARGQGAMLSQSNSTGLTNPRFVRGSANRVILVGAPEASTATTRAISWGRVDAGAPRRVGRDLVVLALDDGGVPVEARWLAAGVNEGSFDSMSGALVEEEGTSRFFIAVEGSFPTTFPTTSGFLVSSGLVSLTNSNHAIAEWGARSHGFVIGGGLPWVEALAMTSPCPGMAPLAARRFSGGSCGVSVPIAGMQPSLFGSDFGLVVGTGIAPNTAELRLVDGTPRDLWRWSASGSVAGVAPVLVGAVDRGSTIVAFWQARGAQFTDRDGVVLNCEGSGQQFLLTQHRASDGRLVWAHCLDGAAQNGVLPFIQAHSFAPLGSGAVVGFWAQGGSSQTSLRVGSRAVSVRPLDRDFLVHFRLP